MKAQHSFPHLLAIVGIWLAINLSIVASFWVLKRQFVFGATPRGWFLLFGAWVCISIGACYLIGAMLSTVLNRIRK